MIQLVRIVEDQAALSSYRATQNEERAVQLELLIEASKPKNYYSAWHPLIATPFRYPPPHQEARFRPPFGKNIFYASCLEKTALYEHAFHFMRERIHLRKKIDTGKRTIFFVEANAKEALHLKTKENFDRLMDKNDYAASHQFISSHPEISFLIYPSCRDPKKRDNAAVLSIHHLDKKPKWTSSIKFFYDNQLKQIKWLDYGLFISWDEVC